MSVFVDRPNLCLYDIRGEQKPAARGLRASQSCIVGVPFTTPRDICKGASASKRSVVSTTFIDPHIIMYGLHGSILAIGSKRELFKTIAVDEPDD